MKLVAGMPRKCFYVFMGVVLFALPGFCGARGSSNYGNGTLLPPCNSPSASFSGVTATCYDGSNFFSPGSFLFNFTLNPSASTSVSSFTADFGSSTPTDFGLVVGDPTCDGVVPCALSNPPPFDVTGSLGTGSQTFDFSGFTAAESGQVTVYFDSATLPTITDITTTIAVATPEPSALALFSIGAILTLGLLALGRFRRQLQ